MLKTLNLLLLFVSAVQSLGFYKVRNVMWDKKFDRILQNQFDTHFIEQKLDHFDPLSTETFKMQYLSNGAHYKRGGAIYIDVGGEWNLSVLSVVNNLMFEMAQKNRGYFFASEHRFYGKSFPDPFDFSQRRFLSMEQALADLAVLIEHIRATVPGLENAVCILSGCSYAGTMVTWFRQKYPHLITGSWSSSGPVFAQHDFYEYMNTVGKGIKKFGGHKCYDQIRDAFDEVTDLIQEKNISELKERLNTTLTSIEFSNKLVVEGFYLELLTMFGLSIQYHGLITPSIENICEIMTKSEDLLKGLSKIIGFYSLMQRGGAHNDVSWLFQVCTQFGWFQTTRASENSIVSVNLTTAVFNNMCSSIFGSKFNAKFTAENVNRTNTIYGGFNLKVSGILSTHGEFDPWRSLGITNSSDVLLNPVIITANASHCADYRSTSIPGSAEIAITKKHIQNIISSWL